MTPEIQPRKFNSSQIKQASAISLTDYFEHRLSVFGITIDDETTVDRDDGIWLVELSNGKFQLQVSITDVSTIVPKNSPIDMEALQRVVTLYHSTPPTPMLPCNISTNLGSLEELQERLALTIFFTIDQNGNVEDYKIKETIFTNRKAFSYEEVEKILANPQDIPEHKLLLKMHQVSQLISQKRGGKSGVLTRYGYVDEDGNLIKENVNTHQLIAELMILTNTTIAKFLADNSINALYRTQDVGIDDFDLVLKTMGHCLVPAIYEPNPKPHVALALKAYTHFTSPLRRYVDLVNHRIIKSILKGETNPYTLQELTDICRWINDFQQKIKNDKYNYLKLKKRKQLDKKFADLDTLDITNLSQDDLSDLIEYTVFNKTIDQIIPALFPRLADLQPKDLYHLWFVGKIDRFFEEENLDGVSVLLIKSQLDNCAIAYKTEYSEREKLYFTFCYIDDLTTEQPAKDIKKSKSKQKSALATIQGYIQGKLTNNPLPIKENDGNILELDKVVNKQGKIDDLTKLNDKDFSKLIVNLQRILVEIENRIDQLPVKDLYKIWFETKINKFYDHDNLDFVSVLLIYSQLNHTQVNYDIEYSEENNQYIAYCSVDNYTHPHGQLDSKKNKVKQKSARAYIESYLQNNLVLMDIIKKNDLLNKVQQDIQDERNREENLVETENLTFKVDWVSELHKICQTKKWNNLDYSFDDIGDFFCCKITLVQDNKTFTSTGYGRSKKDAKQYTSHIFIVQHRLE